MTAAPTPEPGTAGAIEAAARELINLTRRVEHTERGRAEFAVLDLEITLTGGGVETWRITVERTASTH